MCSKQTSLHWRSWKKSSINPSSSPSALQSKSHWLLLSDGEDGMNDSWAWTYIVHIHVNQNITCTVYVSIWDNVHLCYLCYPKSAKLQAFSFNSYLGDFTIQTSGRLFCSVSCTCNEHCRGIITRTFCITKIGVKQNPTFKFEWLYLWWRVR